MTEQNAIEIINGIWEVSGNLPEDGDDVEIALMMAISALEEIQQYRALGTVKELRKATEKQRAKKWDNFIEAEEAIICPVCLTEWDVIDNDVEKFYYCPKCGQKLDRDWSEKDIYMIWQRTK